MKISSIFLPTLLLAGLVSAGCRSLALSSAPDKTPVVSTTDSARQAREGFWDALHDARYEQLPDVTEKLTRSYLENPRDPETALLLGHAHLWRLAERARLQEPSATVTDQIILANKYFGEAKRLAPDDHRIEGWLGGVQIAMGTIDGDEREKREGYFMLKDGEDAFPEFNHFSFAYVLSVLPADDAHFAEAVDAVWKDIDACFGEVDRERTDYEKYRAQETTVGPKRVCWNSAIAPHNYEGFFLSVGEILTKSGKPAQARKLYAAAQHSRDFATWRYAGELNARLEHVEEDARRWRDPDPKNQPTPMVSSDHACTGCHAR